MTDRTMPHRISCGKFLIFLVVAALTLAGCVKAPERAQVTIFNLMSYDILDESIAGIRQGLAESGYTADRVVIREVNANGETTLLGAYARGIVDTHPDVIVPVSTPVTQAVLAAAGPRQPVVFSTVTNPADIGYDKHPANLTGVADVVDYAANVALIRELVPSTRRIGIVYNPGERNSQFGIEQTRRAATANGIQLVLVTATDSNQAVTAARSLFGRVDVLYIGSDNTVASAVEGIVASANKVKLPVIASDSGSVKKGALAAVSVDYRKLGIAAGRLTATILRERKPAGSYPAIHFRGDTLVINAGTAARIGFKWPVSISARKPVIVGARGN